MSFEASPASLSPPKEEKGPAQKYQSERWLQSLGKYVWLPSLKQRLLGNRPRIKEKIKLAVMQKKDSDSGKYTGDCVIARNLQYVSGMTLIFSGLDEKHGSPFDILENITVTIGDTVVMKADAIQLKILFNLYDLNWQKIGDKMYIPVPLDLCLRDNILVLEYLNYSPVRLTYTLRDISSTIDPITYLDVEYGLVRGDLPFTEDKMPSPTEPLMHNMRTLSETKTCSLTDGATMWPQTFDFPVKPSSKATSAVLFYFTSGEGTIITKPMFSLAGLRIDGNGFGELSLVEDTVLNTCQLLKKGDFDGIYCIYDSGNNRSTDRDTTLIDFSTQNCQLRLSGVLPENQQGVKLHICTIDHKTFVYFRGMVCTAKALAGN
jgi:hypothetical protein